MDLLKLKKVCQLITEEGKLKILNMTIDSASALWVAVMGGALPEEVLDLILKYHKKKSKEEKPKPKYLIDCPECGLTKAIVDDTGDIICPKCRGIIAFCI